MRPQTGYSLIEMVVALAILGIMLSITGSFGSQLWTAEANMYREKQRAINYAIVDAMLAWSRHSSEKGRLPEPYDGDGYHSTVYDPSDTSDDGKLLAEYLRRQRISQNEINDDGRAAQRVRVYQRATDLTVDVPMFFSSGDTVTITYDYGVLYMTKCPKDSPCNSGLPGDSSALDSTNYDSWTTTGEDGEATAVSSLPVQKGMLSQTNRRLSTIRRKVSEYVRSQTLQASAADTSNKFPVPSSVSLAGQDPTTNQGCHDGWYNLDTVDVLEQVGLTHGEMAQTAWGAAIEYCPDYEPTATGTGTAGQPPHYGALRINRNVTDQLNPTNNPSDNVVLPI